MFRGPREGGAAWRKVSCLPGDTAAGSRCLPAPTALAPLPPKDSQNTYPFLHAITCPELSHIQKGRVLPVRAGGAAEGQHPQSRRAGDGSSSETVAVRCGEQERVIFGELLVNVSRSCCLHTGPAHSPAVGPAIISWWQSAAARCCHRAQAGWMRRAAALLLQCLCFPRDKAS